MTDNNNLSNGVNYSDEYQIRLQRLAKIKSTGLDPYPSSVVKDQSISKILADFQAKVDSGEVIDLAGRLKSRRLHGGSCFADVEYDGEILQVYFKKDVVGDDQYGKVENDLDVGDFVAVSGTAMLNKTDLPLILVKEFKLITKSLLPLPEKWHGLQDIETRFRKRYLDLLANPETRVILGKRQKIVNFIRQRLISDGFVEVETPILQSVASGAIAKPFVTHHQALDCDLFLRIAPEIYLKELLVGGYSKVFEIARCFRNEGIDTSHNPEFNQVEFYWAYRDYNFLMDYMEKFMADLVMEVCGSLKVTYDNKELDFTPPYPRIDFRQSIIDETGIDLSLYDAKGLMEQATKKGIKIDPAWGKGKIADELYKTFVRPKYLNPAFIINHPIELSPLAKKLDSDTNYVQRFQMMVAEKIELMNAFSELNDPIDQEERFAFQKTLADRGDDEAMLKDDDFIEALKYGMPPAAGLGLGIERLAMLLSDSQNIKEVIYFPTLKPEKN